MNEPMLEGKSHVIPKQVVWDAWLKVKENGGAAGVDGVTMGQFEERVKDNLYKLWNRMSSGSYFPGPVRAVEIPKKGGTRVLGIPNIVDRVAQTVAVMTLEPNVEKVFHEDSYGYRPGRSPQDAVAACRKRCWEKNWVVDMDVKAFLNPWSHCSLVNCGWSEQPVLGCRGFDTQAFPASGADVDGAEPPVLDTLHDGLAGDAVGEGGLQHGQPAVGGVVHEQGADFGGEPDPPGGGGGELLAADEPVAEPAVQGGGRQA
jgi:hypothetical protein